MAINTPSAQEPRWSNQLRSAKNQTRVEHRPFLAFRIASDTAGNAVIHDLDKTADPEIEAVNELDNNPPATGMNDSSDALLLAVMARLIRIESMVCSLSILNMKHMTGDNVEEYRALAKWLGAIRGRIVETSVKSHSEQFPELAKFLEEHIELSERDLTEMFQRSGDREHE
jgi:hypothetical protein